MPLPRGFSGLAAKLATGIILASSLYTTLLTVREMSIIIIASEMMFILLPLEQLGQSNRDFSYTRSREWPGFHKHGADVIASPLGLSWSHLREERVCFFYQSTGLAGCLAQIPAFPLSYLHCLQQIT